VIELLGKDNDVKISPAQMSKIISMLRKEDAVDALDKIKTDAAEALEKMKTDTAMPPFPPFGDSKEQTSKSVEQRKL
jgi:hypothetical protein